MALLSQICCEAVGLLSVFYLKGDLSQVCAKFAIGVAQHELGEVLNPDFPQSCGHNTAVESMAP